MPIQLFIKYSQKIYYNKGYKKYEHEKCKISGDSAGGVERLFWINYLRDLLSPNIEFYSMPVKFNFKLYLNMIYINYF